MFDSDVRTETGSTSPSLIRLVKAGDSAAWQRLARLYGPLVYRWARQAGLQDCDAADVLQEVFRAVFNGLGRFHHGAPNDSFRGWLWTITRNEIRRFYNRRVSCPEAVGGSDAHRQLQQFPDAPDEPSSSQQIGDDLGIVHRALELVRGEFEQRTWQAFWRATLAKQSTSEIAQDLGMSGGSVRQAKYRVLNRLRELLDER